MLQLYDVHFSPYKVVIPGYCVAGTVGHKVLAGQKKIELDKKTVVCRWKDLTGFDGGHSEMLVLITQLWRIEALAGPTNEFDFF